MVIEVNIPTPLRGLTENKDVVSAEGATISELIDNLDKSYPGIKARIVDDAGNLRRFVNIYINGEDVRFLQDKETAVGANDEVSIVPAIAGG
jgi:molybdopterin synthase sulfur carrier subunit